MKQNLRRVVFAVVGLIVGCTSGGERTHDDPNQPASCAGDHVECAGTCADTRGDGQNCGTCGTLCPESQVCSSGTCQQSCSEPERTACGTSCVDLQMNPSHCGACGAACAGDQVCQRGVCASVSGTGESDSGTGGAGSFSPEVSIEEEGLGQCAVDGIVESTNGGFSGTGYLNTDNSTGASIEWALDIGEAGTYSLEFIYANESGDRPANVLVAGAVAAPDISFSPTASWSNWSSVVVDVDLSVGENRIVLEATSASGLANVDRLVVTGAKVSVADCDGGGGTGGGEGTGGSTGGIGGTDPVPPCAMNEISACTEDSNEIACHFGGEPGDYRVTVEFGEDAAFDTVVDAEMHRSMLGQTVTMPGETRRSRMIVNVRAYEGQPLDPDQKGSSTGIPGLDVYIRGAQPKLKAICRELVNPAPKVWLAGDSTVCDQAGTDFSGWGQHLPQFFGDSVSVANYADSGESSSSFLSGAKLWKAITSGWEAGDWVLIQLGHNDKNATAAAFKANIQEMIAQAKAAGVHPVLVTPISRAGTALESQHVNSTGANLPQIMRDLGTQEGVPVLDLTVTTWQWLQTVDWTEYFALGTDRTHPNPRGAGVIAGFVAEAIRDQKLELADHLR